MMDGPAAMKMPRNTRAPTPPKNSTRWYSRGSAKKVKMMAQMKTLSNCGPGSRFPHLDDLRLAVGNHVDDQHEEDKTNDCEP